jgi:hypothetical protein
VEQVQVYSSWDEGGSRFHSLHFILRGFTWTNVLSLLALLVQTDSIYLLAYSEEAPAAGKKKDALQAKTMMLLRASDRWFSMYLFYLITSTKEQKLTQKVLQCARLMLCSMYHFT